MGVTNQDFVAIKLGDVNSSWMLPPVVLQAAPVHFQASNLSGQPGETIKAGITVGEFQGVTSVQFTLQWNPGVLQYVDVGDFGLRGLASDNFGTVFTNSGKLTFSWDDPQGTGLTVPDGTVIFTASFRVIGSAGSMSPLALADSPTPREVSINAVIAPFDSLGGVVSVGATNLVITGGLDAAWGTFQLSIPTMNGVSYVVEYVDTLSSTQWSTLSTTLGDGTIRILAQQGVTNRQRFYRVRVD